MATRRTLGSKTEVSPGVWRLSVSAGRDPISGKRRRPTKLFHGSERDADMELARMLASVGRHSGSVTTLWDFIETMYLPAIAPPELRKRTVDEYRKKLEKYVRPTIGDVRMDRLDRYTMVSWMRGVKTMVPNKQTQLHVYRALSAALGRAVAWGVIEDNILTKAVEPPVPDEHMPTVLTAAEANAYLDAFSGAELEPVVVLAIAGGFRPSEIYALTWADVDFATGVVAVRKGMHQRDGSTWLEEPKSRTSRRDVHMPAWAMDALRPHRGLGRICGDLTPNQITWRYKQHAKKAGLAPWCPLENLRHTSATIGVESGISIEDMARRLGHVDPSMARKRYVKRWVSRDRQAADVLDAFRSRPQNRRDAK